MDIKKIAFPEKQYIKEVTEKKRIILHHTVSSNENSPLNYWESTPDRVAVAYVVAKDGRIIEAYPSEYWAYHIGKGSTVEDNKAAIGIEIVNEGILQSTNGKNFTWLDGKVSYKGEVYTHTAVWRGSKYFAAYTEAQYKAVAELITLLCTKHGITTEVCTDLNYKKEYFQKKGILSHRNLRPDKSDLSPAFDFTKLFGYLNNGTA